MFQVGQLVQCARSLHPLHDPLVGCIGTVDQAFDGFNILLYGGHYAVSFPGHDVSFCQSCQEDHPALHVMLKEELKPIDDPDSEKSTPRIEELEKV